MKIIQIHSDESRHRNEKFLLLGGVWVPEDMVETIELSVTAMREKFGFTNDAGIRVQFLGELKWTKVSQRYLPVYKAAVDLFFEHIFADQMRSCLMLVDTEDPVVREHSNIKTDGYFKLLYQLYFHNSTIPAVYDIYPDQITNPIQHGVDFDTLKKCLNSAFVGKFTSKINPAELPMKGFVKNITPTVSHNSQFIQLLDVVMGGVGYFQNRHFVTPGASSAKVELMKYIIDKLVYSGAVKINGKKYMVVRSTKFNIWLFRPKNKKSP